MGRTATLTALVSAAVGLVASAAAAYVHYHLLGDPSYTSFCDVSATVSCSQVYSSRYGSIGGLPVAIFGAIWFAFAALLSTAGLTARPAVRESVPAYLFAGSTLALSVILYLGYASFFILKMVCILCVFTYAAVIALFLVSGAASTVPLMSLPRRAFQDFKVLVASPLALALALLFLGGAASVVAFFPREGPSVLAAVSAAASTATDTANQDQRSEFERWYASRPRTNLVIPAEGAKVLIVDFSDFQCPYCKQAYESLKPIIVKYNAREPNTVRLVLRDFPLESECNSNVVGGGPHPAACEAAAAVRMARQLNRGEAMEEWLFANQPAMTPASVRQAASDVAKIPNFDARYESTLEQVKSDIAFGHSIGVKSTPTMFINGTMVEGVLAPQYLDQAIAYELARAGGK